MKKTATHDLTRTLLLSTIVLIPCAFLWQTFNSFVMFKQLLLNMLVTVCTIAVLNDKKKLLIPAWSLPISLFALLSTLSGLCSEHPIMATVNSMMLFIYVMFGILLKNSFIHDQKNIIMDMVLYITAAVSLIGILQFFGNGFLSPYKDLPGKWRVFSTFGNPSFLAAFLAGALPLSVHRYLKNKDLGSVLLLTLPALCLILTFARASWISLGLVLVLWAVISKKISFKHLFTVALTIVLLVTAISAARPDFRKHLLNMDSWKGRAFLWMVGTAVIRDHALTGIGLNQFRTSHLQYQHDMLRAHPELIDRFKPFAPVEEFCHNDFIQIIAETGLPGLLFLCYALFALFTALRKHAAHPLTIEFAALLGILGLCVNALFFFPFYLPPTLFLCTILLVLSEKKDVHAHAVRVPDTARYITTGICILIAVGSLTTLISDLYLKRGADALVNGRPAHAETLFQKAIAFNPWSGENRYFLGRALFLQKKYQEAGSVLEATLPVYNNYFVYSLLAFVYNYSGREKQCERVMTFLHDALPGQRITTTYGLALE